MQRIDPSSNPVLDVRDLRVVLALASERTTGRAASVLHLTQPAVSRALCAVEKKLGVSLFERTPRGLVPTAAGELLLQGAARLLAELRDLEHRVCSPGRGPTRVRLVCECYTAYHWLPSALVAMRRSLPDLEVSLAVDHTSNPVPAMEANQVDVALLTTAAVPRGLLVERPLFSDEIVFVMSAAHPLAARRALSPADLCAHTLISSSNSATEYSWFMKSVFGRARPRLMFERFPLTEAILDAARAGMGIAILSEWMTGPHLARGDLVAKRLKAGPLHRSWRLAWRPEVEEAALRLLAALAGAAPHARLVA